RGFREHEKAMREPRRDPQHLLVARSQYHADRTPERRRASPHINRDVVRLARYDPDQLALRVLDLIMQSAQHVPRRAGVIILNELGIDPGLGKRPAIVAFEKKAPRICEHARLD